MIDTSCDDHDDHDVTAADVVQLSNQPGPVLPNQDLGHLVGEDPFAPRAGQRVALLVEELVVGAGPGARRDAHAMPKPDCRRRWPND